jgi:hypothetical protein
MIESCLSIHTDAAEILAAALNAFLEVSCAEGVRWFRQRYCTAENRAVVLHKTLKMNYRRVSRSTDSAAPLSTAALEALLESGAVALVLNLKTGPLDTHDYVHLLWNLVIEGGAEGQSAARQAQRQASARVLLAAAGSAREALLMPQQRCSSILCTAIELRDAELLTLLLSDADAALVRAVLTARGSAGDTVLHHAVAVHCHGGCNSFRSHKATEPCIAVLISAAHAAGCLHDVLSVQDAAGVTAATWLLRIGYSDHAALLPVDNSLKHKVSSSDAAILISYTAQQCVL